MWEPVSLPYKSSTASVALPTTEEIRACSNVLHERFASKIVALNDDIVVKFGADVETLEGQTLIYLEKQVPDVPAPRLNAMYHEADENFLVMQRAPGVTLDQLWPSLTDAEKDAIVEQLRHIFDHLRQAVPPQLQFFGGLDNGSVRHYPFYCQRGESTYLGPFCDESAFIKGLTDNFRALKEANKHPDFKARFYKSLISLGGVTDRDFSVKG